MEYLSQYLTLEQAAKSDTALKKGIDNTPNASQVEALKLLGRKVYDQVKFNFPECYPTSVFRSEELNTIIGGSTSSQHCKGEAVDIDSPSEATNAKVFKFIKDNLNFDQLIAEFCTDQGPSWVHVSFKAKGNRKKLTVANVGKKGERTGQGAQYQDFKGTEPWYIGLATIV